jgi:hypothetical protein
MTRFTIEFIVASGTEEVVIVGGTINNRDRLSCRNTRSNRLRHRGEG